MLIFHFFYGACFGLTISTLHIVVFLKSAHVMTSCVIIGILVSSSAPLQPISWLCPHLTGVLKQWCPIG